MKKKGFTLVELLVVIAIIALLMGILMPALARVRQIAYRLYCGTNLSGIGKAILIYSNDYDDEFPRAGKLGWVQGLNAFASPNPDVAYQTGATISSCFYLLIKFSEVTPKSFLCKGDSGVTEFDPSAHAVPNTMTLVDIFDFGATQTQEHCSYAYHNPFPQGTTGFNLTSSSDPGMAIAADPNPWQPTFENPAKVWANYSAVYAGPGKQDIQKGNAGTHQDDGQNVLFVDGHTSFEKDSRCGVDMDNIYTRHEVATPGTPPNEVQRQRGASPATGPANPANYFPMNRNDSVLLTDGAPAR
jgi:prepilin-type N-terminal cleavage/methylation domain-containing protein/prepilin-type processing-associated H-X9-DG protein